MYVDEIELAGKKQNIVPEWKRTKQEEKSTVKKKKNQGICPREAPCVFFFEKHWDIDQVLEGWEPRDAGVAPDDAGDDPMILPINLVEVGSFSGRHCARAECMECPFSSSSSRGRSGPVSTIKKKSVVLKKAMADKHSKWHSKACSSWKDRWYESQSSQVEGKSNCKDARWTDVTKDLEHLQKVVDDKKTTWDKSMREALGRDNDLMVTMENNCKRQRRILAQGCPRTIGIQMTKGRRGGHWGQTVFEGNVKKCGKCWRTRGKDKTTVLRRIRQLFEQVASWRKRFGFLSTQTFRKSQSSDTKSLNIEKDLNEISWVVHGITGDISLEDVQVWRKARTQPCSSRIWCSSMDDVVAMVAEWCSFADTARLRSVSTRCFKTLCDWPLQQILLQLDEEVWESRSSEWVLNHRIPSHELKNNCGVVKWNPSWGTSTKAFLSVQVRDGDVLGVIWRFPMVRGAELACVPAFRQEMELYHFSWSQDVTHHNLASSFSFEVWGRGQAWRWFYFKNAGGFFAFPKGRLGRHGTVLVANCASTEEGGVQNLLEALRDDRRAMVQWKEK